MSKTKSNTRRKYAFTNQKKCTTTQNEQKELKPGLVAFYNIRPGNGAGLFSKEKISKKSEEKKDKHGSIRYKQTNNIYSAEKNRIKGALRPEPARGRAQIYSILATKD